MRFWAGDDYDTEEENKLRAMFNELDYNGSGNIDRQEFVSGMRRMLPTSARPQARLVSTLCCMHCKYSIV